MPSLASSGLNKENLSGKEECASEQPYVHITCLRNYVLMRKKGRGNQALRVRKNLCMQWTYLKDNLYLKSTWFGVHTARAQLGWSVQHPLCNFNREWLEALFDIKQKAPAFQSIFSEDVKISLHISQECTVVLVGV